MQIRVIHLAHRTGLARFSEGDRHPLIATVQELLARRSLYDGPADACFDFRTAEAVSRFQDAQGLKPTGCLDPVTYCRLCPASETAVTPITKPRASSGLVRANILISKGARQLTLFDGNTPYRQYPVAIGKPTTPTPEGNYAIASKIANPGGILGSRWMGLNFDAYGIHGTNTPCMNEHPGRRTALQNYPESAYFYKNPPIISINSLN